MITKNIINARTLSCPQPVMLTIKVLEEADEFNTVVDNEAARDNVCRLGKAQGCEVSVEPKDEGIYLTLKRTKAEPAKGKPKLVTGVMWFIGSDALGTGEDEQLGGLLTKNFFHTLERLTWRPETIILIDNGVKLVTKDSPTAGESIHLEDQAIRTLTCGTCLSRFQLTEKMAVGPASDMYTIADTLLGASKIISYKCSDDHRH